MYYKSHFGPINRDIRSRIPTTVCIDYSSCELPDWLQSAAGSSGRWLLRIAEILSSQGFLIDIIYDYPNTFDYPNIRFISRDLVKEYDIVIWNGWSSDSPVRRGMKVIYLEFFPNWTMARPLQKEWLSTHNNIIIGYGFPASEQYFKSAGFADKCEFIPYPLYKENKDTNNFRKTAWSISTKKYQEPSLFMDNYLEHRHLVEERAPQLVPFPINQPITEVFKTIQECQLLFPFHNSGSSFEAIQEGCVPLPVFGSEPHVGSHFPLYSSGIEAGTLLTYPLSKERVIEVIQQITSSEDEYMRVLNLYRKELSTNSYQSLIDTFDNM